MSNKRTDLASLSASTAIQDKQNKEHLLDLGRLLGITLDLETTDLNAKYAIPTQAAARVTDITNEEISRIDIRVQVPEHIVQSPAAAVITQSFPREIHYGTDRKPPHIAAGQIAHTYASLYRILWDKIGEDRTIVSLGDEEQETVRFLSTSNLKKYPDDMDITSDTFRLHDNGDTLSYLIEELPDLKATKRTIYRDESGSFWCKIKAGQSILDESDILWNSSLSDVQRIKSRPVKIENVRFYYYQHPDGTEEVIRLHNNGKQLSRQVKEPNQKSSYFDIDGNPWVKTFSNADSRGFNSIAFDSKILKQFGFLSLLPGIIFDRLKQNHLFQTDIRVALKASVAYNDKGAFGIQPGKATHPVTGKQFVSFGLSATMEANGPERHGMDGTIRMPDGSLYERRLGHLDALYDIDATDALAGFIRQHNPEIMRQLELNADLESYQTFLIGHDGFNDRPLRSFIRNNYPHSPSVHVGVCIGLEQDISEIRQGLIARTDIDTPLELYQYKGKYLFGGHETPADLLMSQADIEEMLREQKKASNPDALFEVVNIRKNQAVFDDHLAYVRGKVSNPEWQQRQRTAILNSFMLHNRQTVIMAALQKITPQFLGAVDTSITRVEEETHTRFQKPKALYLLSSNGSQPAPDVINAHAEIIWDQADNIDHTLRRVLGGPEPLEWIDEIPDHQHKDILEAFLDKITKAKKDLQKYQTQIAKNPIVLVEPDADKPIIPWKPKSRKEDSDEEDSDEEDNIKIDDKETENQIIHQCCLNAVEYLWKLRAVHRAAFYDVSNSYRIYDRYNHEVPTPDLLGTHESILSQRLSSGEYSIKFEGLRFSSEQIVRMFMTTPGRLDWIKKRLEQKIQLHGAEPVSKESFDKTDYYWKELSRWEKWQEHYEATAALHLWGPPHLEARDHPWMSGQRALEEIKDIKANLRIGGDLRATEDKLGLWEILISNRDQSEEILNQLEQHIKLMLKKYQLTPERKNLLGYHDRKTLYGAKNNPIEAIKYEIPAQNCVLLLDVPDSLLASPLRHLEKGSNLIPVILPYADLKPQLTRPDLSILFRGQESGKIFLGAKTSCLDDIHDNPWFNDLYAEADTHHINAGGSSIRNNSNLVWLKAERTPSDTPLALRSPDITLQTIKLRRPDFFDATVSTKLSHKPVLLTGYIDRLDTPPPHTGVARLQEMTPVGASSSASVEQKYVETGWERPISIKTVKVLNLDEFKKTISRSIKFHNLTTQLGITSPHDVKDYIHSDEDARKYGFKNRDDFEREALLDILTQQEILSMGYSSFEDARGKVRHLFSDKDRSEADSQAKVVVVNFQNAEKSATTYYQPARRPDSTSGSRSLRPLASFKSSLTKQEALKLWSNPGKVLNLQKQAL